MPLVKTPSGSFWVPEMSPKGVSIYNNQMRFLLVAGPRRSGKTIGVCDRVWRHCWDVDRARVGVWVKFAKLAMDGGCWTDLNIRLEDQWLASNMGMKLIKAGHEPISRQPFLDVSNRYGTKSRVSLNSLDFDANAETLMRGKKYSMVWMNEFSNFKTRKVFDTAIECLRVGPNSSRQFIADTNPDEEGEDSWIWKLWWGERLADQHPDPAFRDQLDVIEVMIEDNPFLTTEERTLLEAQYRHDPDLYNRYILGRWTRATTDSVFSDVFRHELHIIGDCSHRDTGEWDLMLPQDDCTDLVTGWDLGSVNFSISFMEPATIDGMPTFKLLDEVVWIKKKVGLEDLVEAVLEKMAFWERQVGKPIMWRHWSDKQALDTHRPIGDTYDAAYVYKYSGGQIDLKAAPKFPDAVRMRVVLLRRLLFGGRVLVGANCPAHISMLKGLRKGTTALSVIDRLSVHKHPFDSFTYALQSELPLEFMDTFVPTSQSKGRVVCF